MQQTKEIRSQANHIRQGLQALMRFFMQSAHFCKIFLKKKIGEVEIEVLSIGRRADENYISRCRWVCTACYGNTLTEYAEKCTALFPVTLWTDNLTRRQCTYNVTLRRVRAATVGVEKQWVLHIVSVCVCVCVCLYLSIQHAMRMRRIVICGLPRSTIFCFQIIS